MKRVVLAAVTVSVIFLIAACSVTTNTTNDHKNMKDKKQYRLKQLQNH